MATDSETAEASPVTSTVKAMAVTGRVRGYLVALVRGAGRALDLGGTIPAPRFRTRRKRTSDSRAIGNDFTIASSDFGRALNRGRKQKTSSY